MTSLQKTIVLSLLEGCNIADCKTNGYRLRTRENCVIAKFYEPTFYSLKKFLRKEKNGLYVINKKALRSLHGKTWMKREYKKTSVNNSNLKS